MLVTNSNFAAQRREHRMSLLSDDDGNKIARYRGGWKDGAFEYEVAFERPDGDVGSGTQLIRRSFRPTPDGLLVTVAVNPPDGLFWSGSTAMPKTFRCRRRRKRSSAISNG